MLSFEESQEYLEQFVDELPPVIFEGLNCGVSLREGSLYDENGLLILGQYHYEPYGLGRYVTINYGSLVAAYSHFSPENFAQKIKYVLHHELTHHLENKAGDRTLEIQDAVDKIRMLGL